MGGLLADEAGGRVRAATTSMRIRLKEQIQARREHLRRGQAHETISPAERRGPKGAAAGRPGAAKSARSDGYQNAWRCGSHRTLACLAMNGQRSATGRAFQTRSRHGPAEPFTRPNNN